MKILIVENNPQTLAELEQFIAKELGHQTKLASDGLMALHQLDSFVPDVVICDLIMPNIGGDKLCDIIRDTPHLSHCFIIILSAIAAEETAGETGCNTKKYNADACVAKGRLSELRSHIARLLEQAGQHKSDSMYDADLTLGLDQMRDREITRELLKSRDYFKDIVENLSDALFGLSLDGRIIYLNSAASRLCGLSEEKLLGKEFFSFFNETDSNIVQHGLQSVAAGKRFSNRIIENDPPLYLNGYFVSLECMLIGTSEHPALVVLARDRSEQVIEEKTRVAEEQNWRLLFEHIPAGLVLLEKSNKGNLLVRSANPKACDWLGLKKEELVGRRIDRLCPADEQTALKTLLDRTLASGRCEEQRISESNRCFRCSPLVAGVFFLFINHTPLTVANISGQ